MWLEILLSVFSGCPPMRLDILLGVKRAVLVRLKVLSLKWVTAEASALPFRVLSRKKYVRKSLTHLQSSLSQLLKILKVSINVLL